MTAALTAALAAADRVLAEGDLLCMFPDGGLSPDGTLLPFQAGLMEIVQRRRVAVVPVALSPVRGLLFSRSEGGTAMKRPGRRGWFSEVSVVCGPALMPDPVTPERMRERVAALLRA